MKKSRIVLAASILPAVMIASGCSEIAYKTGAGADALQADQRSCKKGGNDAIAYRSCMKDKGWAIANMDGGGPVSPMVTAQPGLPQDKTAATPAGPVQVSGWFKFGGGGPEGDIAACAAALGPADPADATNRTVTPALLACMNKKGWRAL